MRSVCQNLNRGLAKWLRGARRLPRWTEDLALMPGAFVRVEGEDRLYTSYTLSHMRALFPGRNSDLLVDIVPVALQDQILPGPSPHLFSRTLFPKAGLKGARKLQTGGSLSSLATSRSPAANPSGPQGLLETSLLCVGTFVSRLPRETQILH